MKCTNCGKDVKDDSKVCPECGSEIEQTPIVEEYDYSIKNMWRNFKGFNIKQKAVTIFVILLTLGFINNIFNPSERSRSTGGNDRKYISAISAAEDYYYKYYKVVDCNGVWIKETSDSIGMVVKCNVKFLQEDEGETYYFAYYKKELSSRYHYWTKSNLNDAIEVLKNELHI